MTDLASGENADSKCCVPLTTGSFLSANLRPRPVKASVPYT